MVSYSAILVNNYVTLHYQSTQSLSKPKIGDDSSLRNEGHKIDGEDGE